MSSKSNRVYIRFYAEKSGIESKFSSVVTRLKSLGTGETCEAETEYDCDDATCIHPSLVCNGIRNCKFGWDEESCEAIGSSIAMDFASPHVIVILVILTLILLGMFAGMIWNLLRKLSADKEELAVSREKSLAASSRMSVNQAQLDPDLPHIVPPAPMSKKSNGGCYVPDSGYPFPANQRI